MNKLQIFNNEQFGQVKEIEKRLKGTYLGVFYAMEYGNQIKIGHSTKPYTRFIVLKRNAEKYGALSVGRVCISVAHTNHRENERSLHNRYANYRKEGTELFDIRFDDFVSEVESSELEFKDDTEKIKASSKAFVDGMKQLLFGGIFASGNEIEMSVSPVIPDDVRAHIEACGYELHGSRGDWYVSGEEGGEPFELGLDLFTALYRAKQ